MTGMELVRYGVEGRVAQVVLGVRGGVLEAGSDVEAAAFVAPADIGSFRITEKAAGVIVAAMRLAKNG